MWEASVKVGGVAAVVLEQSSITLRACMVCDAVSVWNFDLWETVACGPRSRCVKGWQWVWVLQVVGAARA